MPWRDPDDEDRTDDDADWSDPRYDELCAFASSGIDLALQLLDSISDDGGWDVTSVQTARRVGRNEQAKAALRQARYWIQQLVGG